MSQLVGDKDRYFDPLPWLRENVSADEWHRTSDFITK
jgi:hypothetical protein